MEFDVHEEIVVQRTKTVVVQFECFYFQGVVFGLFVGSLRKKKEKRKKKKEKIRKTKKNVCRLFWK